MTYLPLVVVISVHAGVIYPSHIHYHIATLQLFRVPSAYYLRIDVLWEQFEHVASKGLITVKCTIVGADGFSETRPLWF